jgi:hypothetical protein
MEVYEPAVAPPGRGSSATALLVRRLVTAVMRPQEDVTDRRRIRQWRQEWLALPSEVIPAVIGPDQVVRSGLHALDYLAHLASLSPVVPRTRQPLAAAAAAWPAATTSLARRSADPGSDDAGRTPHRRTPAR